jgi:hypothetical protein
MSVQLWVHWKEPKKEHCWGWRSDFVMVGPMVTLKGHWMERRSARMMALPKVRQKEPMTADCSG